MEIIAHRGASGHAVENTLAAFRLAWAQGADGVEMDVHLSRDARLMVHHDPDTQRTAGADHAIAQTDSRVLRGLGLRHGRHPQAPPETMPYLEEVLALVPPGGRVLIELKCGPDAVPALKRALAGGDPSLRLSFISFHIHTLAACHTAFPTIACYPVMWAPRDGDGRPLPHPHELIDLALAHGFAGLDPEFRGIDEHFADACHQAGLGLLTWTVNEADEARRLAGLGLEGLATDYPAAIRTALEDVGVTG